MFRLQVPLLISCLLFTSVMSAIILLRPRIWEADLSILVRNTRPPVEVGPLPTTPQSPPPVDDAQIGTEIQFLSSHDLHADTVTTLHPELLAADGSTVGKAIRKFESNLKISPIPRTALIKVTYSGSSASDAQKTLKVLTDTYLTYHLKLHGGKDALEFFEQEASRYRDRLTEARNALTAYEQRSDISSLAEQTDLTLRKLTEVRSQLNDASTEDGEAQARLSHLTSELSQLQPRMITQQRAVPNQYSAERLNTMLLELQNKRTALLTQYRPEDRRVVEVENEITQTKAAITAAQSKHETEETTDVNPIRQGFESDLAKTRVASAALIARRISLIRQAADYEKKLKGLTQATGTDQQLQLTVKQAEENFTLYQHKLEEARIGSALDSGKIANVTVADGPTLPVTAVSRLGLAQISGLLLGNLIIIALFVSAGVRHRVLYTASDAELLTGFPVLATVPFEKLGHARAPMIVGSR